MGESPQDPQMNNFWKSMTNESERESVFPRDKFHNMLSNWLSNAKWSALNYDHVSSAKWNRYDVWVMNLRGN